MNLRGRIYINGGDRVARRHGAPKQTPGTLGARPSPTLVAGDTASICTGVTHARSPGPFRRAGTVVVRLGNTLHGEHGRPESAAPPQPHGGGPTHDAA